MSSGAEAILPIQEADAGAVGCGSQHCITCGDDGEPMRVVAVNRARGLALCQGDSRRISVEIALVAPVDVGDRLLVHAGTAIARLETT